MPLIIAIYIVTLTNFNKKNKLFEYFILKILSEIFEQGAITG